MTWAHTRRSESDYRGAPPAVQKAFDKQVRLLAKNLNHPSLQAKKYDKATDLWQARVNGDWLRIPAKPITHSELMAITVPSDADHRRSEATLGCSYHAEVIGIRQSLCA